MKRSRLAVIAACLSLAASSGPAQTLYVPSGTGGIGTSSQTGNVGIGTAAPATALDVVGSISATGNLRLNNNSWVYGKTPSGAWQTLIGSTGSYNLAIGDGAGWSNIVFYPGSGEAMRITQAGNVGIGTVAPGARLELAGGSGSTGVQAFFSVQAGFGNPAAGTSGFSGGTKLVLWNDVTTPQKLSIGMDANADMWFNNAGGQAGAGFTFYTGNGGAATPTAQLRITKDGNVGIGTAAPSAKLDVNAGTGETPLNLNGAASGFGIRFTGGANGYIGAGNWAVGNLPTGYLGISGGATGGVALGYNAGVEALRVSTTGNVGIGTTNPTQKLSVNGAVRAKEVIVDTGWSDYVFNSDYRLAPLSEVEGVIQRDGHLPGIPPAKEVAAQGVSVGDMQAKLLAKIEELTLHQIEQEKRLNAQASEIETLATRNAALEKRLAATQER